MSKETLSLGTSNNHGNLRVPPPFKGILRAYWTSLSVNHRLVRPYFLGREAILGTSTLSTIMVQRKMTR